MSETFQGTWPGGVRKGSDWLCYAEPSAGRQKSRILGNQRISKADFLGEEQLGKLGEEEDEEEEPVAEQRREYTDLGFDF